MLAAILAELARLFRQSAAEPQAFGRQFQDLCLQIDRQLVVRSPSGSTQGRCRGIAPDGALLLETERGLERIYSGVLGRAPGIRRVRGAKDFGRVYRLTSTSISFCAVCSGRVRRTISALPL